MLSAQGLRDEEVNDLPLKRKQWTRKIWEKSMLLNLGSLDVVESPTAAGAESPAKKQAANAASTAAKYDQLAKYSTHHVPDPESRCASRMVQLTCISQFISEQYELYSLQEGSNSPTLCKNQCRVLSISGTPVHHKTFSPFTMGDTTKPGYEPLLRCLAMENRKAGGYFLDFLGKLEDAVYMNCLRFWREVQEYKSLFIQPSFSPCAVEMKAKVSVMIII